MWRVKTEQELLAEGWAWDVGDTYRKQPYLFPPDHLSHLRGAWFEPEKFTDGMALEQDEIQDILNSRDRTLVSDRRHQWSWGKEMFIEDTPLVPLCNCSWNKHPLFCRCK